MAGMPLVRFTPLLLWLHLRIPDSGMLTEPWRVTGWGCRWGRARCSSQESSFQTLVFIRHLWRFLKKWRFLNSTANELIRQAWDGPESSVWPMSPGYSNTGDPKTKLLETSSKLIKSLRPKPEYGLVASVRAWALWLNYRRYLNKERAFSLWELN